MLATLACAILGLVATSAAATAPRAVVVKAYVSPSRLGVSGGHVEVTGTVRHATWCQLKLLSRLSVVVVYSHNPKSCATGKYSARILVGSDPRYKDRTVAFALVAGNKTSSTTQRVVLTLAEPAGPKTTPTTTATKAGEGPTGTTTSSTSTTVGTTTTSGPVTTTTPVIILPELPAPSGTTSTTAPSTTTTAPATTTTAPATTTTTTGATTSSTTSTTTSTSSTTTTLVTTTTAPTTTTTVPTTVVYSSNWSGYAVSSGPYNEIEGTFTVPTITSAATCTEHVAEWVGIDGWNAPGLAYNGSLIQAGVDGSMTDPDTGTCTPGKFWVWPWWEILPQDETPIDTVTVTAGDQVTVSISQTEATTWAITLTDDTNHQSYTTDQSYGGPGASGEWVVEASSTSACRGSVVQGSDICQLAPYCVTSGASCTGPVPFSDMSVDGAEAAWWQVYMVQNGATVATPSALGANGFSVAYAGTQAGTSSPAAGPGSLLTVAGQPRDKVLSQPVSAG